MTICVVAGGGDLPKVLLKGLMDKGQQACLILIKGNAEKENYSDYDFIELDVGKVGHAIDYMREKSAKNIVFAGSVSRPNIFSIVPDLKGAILLAQVLKSKILGDDHLLKSVLKFFENEGFNILSVTDIVDLSASIKGALTILKPTDEDIKDIKLGVDLLNRLSELDIGQGAVVSEGRVLSIEAAEGTDGLIKRSRDYIKGARSVFVKIPKLNQDKRVDMPTIGPKTLDLAAIAGIKGIAISSEVLVLSKEDTIAKANQLGIYIYII